jgi:hypothetical protein
MSDQRDWLRLTHGVEVFAIPVDEVKRVETYGTEGTRVVLMDKEIVVDDPVDEIYSAIVYFRTRVQP